MMASASISEEDKNISEKEFSSFLIQRINQSGGSIQFQHLYGALQQIRYEVREAFGTSKSDLMKFLRAHRNSFKIDSKGIVTVVETPTEESENSDRMELVAEVSSRKIEKTLPPKIENGVGKIMRISAEFGVIMADEPVRTCVYFTPANYTGNKESLFIDHDLGGHCEVYFNAVYGNDDHEVQYRAVKVWRKRDENEYPINHQSINKYSHKNVEVKNEAYTFDEDDLKAKKQSKYQRKVVEVTNSEKCYNQPPSHSRENDKEATARKKEVLENEPGRIHPYENRNGAIIKFGKNYTELAAGDSSAYYLYGTEVSDICWEFTEGQDVFFDAVPIKTAPYWKAVTVWIGEKPSKAKRKMCIEEIDESDEQNCVSASSESSKCKTAKSHFNTEFVGKKPNTTSDHSISKKGTRSCAKYKHSNFEYSKSNAQKTQINKFRSKKSDPKRKHIRFWESSEENSESENETSNSKNFQKVNNYESPVSKDRFKFKTSEEEEISSSEHSYETLPENFKNDAKKKANIRIFNNIDGEITRLHCQAAFIMSPDLQKEINFMMNNFYLHGQSASDHSVADLREVLQIGDLVKCNCFIIIDDQADEYITVTMAWKGKKPEESHEMTPEEFIIENDLSVTINNDLDGNSIQEHENTRNRFLTVVKNVDSDTKHDSQNRSSALNIELDDVNDVSEDINDISEDRNDTTEEENDVSEDKSDTSGDEIRGHCAESLKKENSKDYSINVQNYKLLSEKIIQELKNSGGISFHPEVDLSSVIDGISTILKNSNIKDKALNQEVPLRSYCLSDPSELLCSECVKRRKSSTVEVQTIITGEIVATSIYTQN